MNKSTMTQSLLIITSIILLACSLLPIQARLTELPVTFTSAPVLPPTEQSAENGTALENENLLVEVPKGFKIDYQGKDNNFVINEMVPQSESVSDWTTLITVEIFLGEKNTTPEQYQ